MIDASKLQVGDLLFYRGSGLIGGLISWLSGGRYTHVSVVSNTIDNNIKIIEAHLDAKDDNGNKVSGVLEKTLNIDKWECKCDAKRLIGCLTRKAQNTLILGLRRDYVGKVKYDLESFPSMFFYSRICKWLRLDKWRKGKPILNDMVNPVCSTLVDIGYHRYLDIDLLPKLNDNSASPSDLSKSKLLYSV